MVDILSETSFPRAASAINPFSGFLETVLRPFGAGLPESDGVAPDGRVGVTGHDAHELYLLDLPSRGGVATLAAVRPFPGEGQAFAWDPSRPGEMVAISRKGRAIVVARYD